MIWQLGPRQHDDGYLIYATATWQLLTDKVTAPFLTSRFHGPDHGLNLVAACERLTDAFGWRQHGSFLLMAREA